MLSDPRITKPLAKLTAALDLAELLNDPLTRTGDGTASGKPGSRPPGRTQCDWVVREMERILERAAADAARALNNARPRETAHAAVTSIGGIPVQHDEAQERRATRIRGHLVAKANALGVMTIEVKR